MLSTLPDHLRRLVTVLAAVTLVGGGVAAAEVLGADESSLGDPVEEVVDDEAVEEEPPVEDPVVEDPVVEDPVVEDEPPVEDPVVEDPVVEEEPPPAVEDDESPVGDPAVEEDAPVAEDGAGESSHGAAVSAAARDRDAWRDLGCRNHGQYVSGVARGLADPCAVPAGPPAGAPPAETGAPPVDADGPAEPSADAPVEATVAGSDDGRRVPPGHARRDR